MDKALTQFISSMQQSDVAARRGALAARRGLAPSKLPPMAAEGALDALGQGIADLKEDGKTSDVLNLVARAQVNRIAAEIVLEAAQDEGLKAKLIEAGLLTESNYGGPGYPYYSGGPNSVTALSDFRGKDLKKLAEIVAAAKAEPNQRPSRAEFLDRAGRLLELLGPVAEVAGVPEGNTPGEAAAREVNSALNQLSGVPAVRQALVAAGLAPNVGPTASPAVAYRLTYTAEEVERIRLLLADEAQKGPAGASGSATWAQIELYGGILDKIEAARDANFPGQVKTADQRTTRVTEDRRLFDAVDAALKAKDAEKLAAAAKDLDASLASSWWKDLFLIHMEAARARLAPANPDYAAWHLRFLGERAAGQAWNAEGLEATARRALKDARGNGAAAAWRGAADMLDASKGAAPLRKAVAAELQDATKDAVRDAISFYGGVSSRDDFIDALLDAGVLRARNPRSNYYAGEHFTGTTRSGTLRDGGYVIAHLRTLRAAMDKAVEGKTLTDDQKARHAAKQAEIDAMIRAAEKAQVPDAWAAEQRVADEINVLLSTDPLPNYQLYNMLARAGLAPAWTGGLRAATEADFPKSYTADQVRAIRDLFAKTLASGQDWDWNGNPVPMSSAHKRYFAAGIEFLDAALRRHFPATAAEAPASLSGILASASSATDPAARAAAYARARALLDGSDADAALARLAVARPVLARDSRSLQWILEYLAARGAGPSGRAFSTGSARDIWAETAGSLADLGKGGDVQSLLEGMLAKDDAAKAFVRDRLADQAGGIMERAEAAWPYGSGAAGQEFSSAGLKKYGRARDIYSDRQLERIGQIIAGLEAKTDSQKAVKAFAEREIP
ncbi:MAG TPA: hypothetical protein VNI01_05715, partial [Elusimicrobiota bacterium]|nr:hypothetical protein [Elusimicrobiota bacterium]